MALKICEKCRESVDEAKAFCPACGSAFVTEEKRESSSEFDKYAGTMNMSQSVYNMMLSEMPAKPVVPEKVSIVKPIFTEPDSHQNKPSVQASESSNWLIYALVGGVIFVFLLLAIGALLFFLTVWTKAF